MKWYQSLTNDLWLLWRSIRLIKVGNSLLSVFGALWLLIEVFAFFNKQDFADHLKEFWWLFFIIGIILAIYQNWPKNKYTAKVNNRDVSITLQIGDIFKIEGALIIPVNNRLDVDNNGIVAKSSSILRFFIDLVYNKTQAHLALDISNQLQDSSKWYSNFILTENPRTYKIGTVVPIYRDEKQFYLLCNSILNEQNRSKSTEDDLRNSLVELWAYLSHCGSKDILVIPILGTGHGRIHMTREEVIKEIVLSFLSSLGIESYCEELIICIHPNDIKKYNVNIEDIVDFIRLNCMNANFSRISDTPEGQTIT